MITEKRSIVYKSYFCPTSYSDMEGWLNSLTSQEWLAIIGAYSAGGINNIILLLKRKYPYNLRKWKDKDLQYFFKSHPLNNFRNKYERV